MTRYGHVSDFFKSDFLFHVHFSVVICDFLVESSQITIVLMHVPFRIHYRDNLIDKKHSYLIPRPPSWDDRNCSYGHQLYPSVLWQFDQTFLMELQLYLTQNFLLKTVYMQVLHFKCEYLQTLHAYLSTYEESHIWTTF